LATLVVIVLIYPMEGWEYTFIEKVYIPVEETR